MPDEAGDESFTHASPDELTSVGIKHLLVYDGPAMPDQEYIDAVLAAGISVTFIHETDPRRALDGYDAGVAEARTSDVRVGMRGYPLECRVMVVVSDQDGQTPGSPEELDAVAEFSRGWGDTTVQDGFDAYGNRGCVDAAKRGSPKCIDTWVPSTWGANDSDALWQEANHPNPLPGVDADSVHKPDWGQWSLGAPAPVSKSRSQRMEMLVGQLAADGQVTIGGAAIPLPAHDSVAVLFLGSKPLSTWAQASGIPTGAVDWLGQHGRADRVTVTIVDPAQLAAAIA